MEQLIQRFYEKYAQTNTNTIRDFINIVDWNNRMIGIKGARGVGKTTLLLQYIKKAGVFYILTYERMSKSVLQALQLDVHL